MLAVFEQALADLRSVSGNVSRQARVWFLARDKGSEHLFSFARICTEFGYDPATVRSHVLAGLIGNSKGIRERQGTTRDGYCDPE